MDYTEIWILMPGKNEDDCTMVLLWGGPSSWTTPPCLMRIRKLVMPFQEYHVC